MILLKSFYDRNFAGDTVPGGQGRSVCERIAVLYTEIGGLRNEDGVNKADEGLAEIKGSEELKKMLEGCSVRYNVSLAKIVSYNLLILKN